jgi:Protein kinase domain
MNDRPLYEAARMLVALKTAMNTLLDYYANGGPDVTVMDNIPCWDMYEDLQAPGSWHTFTYQTTRHFEPDWLFEPNWPLWFATDNETGKPICIKIPQFYCQEAHQFMADNKWAPKLLGYRRIPPYWHLVVMEDLTEEYQSLRPSAKTDNTPAVWENFLCELRNAIKSLHDHKYVHGDIRPPNIMVKPDLSHFKIIDFDWAGPIENTLYPCGVNCSPSQQRPDGVTDGQPILPEHDDHMINMISLW